MAGSQTADSRQQQQRPQRCPEAGCAAGCWTTPPAWRPQQPRPHLSSLGGRLLCGGGAWAPRVSASGHRGPLHKGGRVTCLNLGGANAYNLGAASPCDHTAAGFLAMPCSRCAQHAAWCCVHSAARRAPGQPRSQLAATQVRSNSTHLKPPPGCMTATLWPRRPPERGDRLPWPQRPRPRVPALSCVSHGYVGGSIA